MPEGKTCPFYLIFYKEEHHLCNESYCQLWSPETQMCSISMGMNAILSVADAIRGISEHLKSNYPE